MLGEREQGDDPHEGQTQDGTPSEDNNKDEVQEQSEESFPASDPPSY